MNPFEHPPTIIGTVSTRAELDRFPERENVPCDMLEARLDLIGWQEDGWLAACQAVESAGTPVLLTLRLAAEGGKWEDRDTHRAQHLFEAVDALSAIDVEHQSELAAILVERAAAQGKTVVLSYHDFERTPDDDTIRRLIGEMAATASTGPGDGNVIAKLALMANSQDDVERLAALLAEEHPAPLCLIAMGDDWADTRVDFPAAGSALTYAYLDTPSAPGQLSCGEVRERLSFM